MGQDSKTEFGKRISDVLEARGKKQKDLCEIGLTEQQVSRLMNKQEGMRLETLVNISRYLEVSVDYLLGLSEYETTRESIKTAAKTTGLSEDAISNLRKLKNAEQYSVTNIDHLFKALDLLLSNYRFVGVLGAIHAYLTSDFDTVIYHPLGNGIEEAKNEERIPIEDYAIPIYTDEWTDQHMASFRLTSDVMERAVLVYISNKLSGLRKSLKEGEK